MINEPSGIKIVLKANKKNDATIFEDEPLTLSASLVNVIATSATSANSYYINQIVELKKRFDSRKISEEDYKIKTFQFEKKLVEVKTFSFGGPEGWPQFIRIWAKEKDTWIKTNWPLKLLIFLPKTEVVNLNGKTSCYVEYGIDPDDSERPKGAFTLKAILEISPNKNIESNTCKVNFFSKKMQKSDKETESTMLNLGRYAYKRMQYEKSMEYADSILMINPDSILGWSLKGEIEEIRGNLDKAESAYSKSIEAFWKQSPQDAEPPISLERNLTRVKSKKFNSTG